MFGSNYCSQVLLILLHSYFCTRVERGLHLPWVAMPLTAWIMLNCHKNDKWCILAIKANLMLNFSVLLQGTRNVLPGQNPYIFVQKYPDKQYTGFQFTAWCSSGSLKRAINVQAPGNYNNKQSYFTHITTHKRQCLDFCKYTDTYLIIKTSKDVGMYAYYITMYPPIPPPRSPVITYKHIFLIAMWNCCLLKYCGWFEAKYWRLIQFWTSRLCLV